MGSALSFSQAPLELENHSTGLGSFPLPIELTMRILGESRNTSALEVSKVFHSCRKFVVEGIWEELKAHTPADSLIGRFIIERQARYLPRQKRTAESLDQDLKALKTYLLADNLFPKERLDTIKSLWKTNPMESLLLMQESLDYLSTVWEVVCRDNPAAQLPLLSSALEIRQWMKMDDLSGVNVLKLFQAKEASPIGFLPRECLGFTHLRVLVLGDNSLENLTLRDEFPQLMLLKLEGNSLKSCSLNGSFEHLVNFWLHSASLRNLNLTGNFPAMKSLTMQKTNCLSTVALSGAFGGIESIVLRNSQLETMGLEGHFPLLSSIDVENNLLNQAGLSGVFSSLESMNLSNDHSQEEKRELVLEGSFKNLYSIALDYTTFARNMPLIGELPALQVLHIDGEEFLASDLYPEKFSF